jgi:RimJ/RimL family protein N-acetyltransferase
MAERAGFRLEGELHNYEIGVNGALRDTLIFGLLPSDLVSA